MAYGFEAVGWEDYPGGRHEGRPDEGDIGDTFGILVHAYNEDDPDDHHFFWAFVGGAFEDWDEWWAYIDSMMDMYGMA